MTKFNNGVVYVKKISPETVLDDYSWLIDKAKLNDNFEKDITTFLKVNISWDRYYPGCSSAPWQIEGIADKLLKLGYKNLIAAHVRARDRVESENSKESETETTIHDVKAISIC